MYVCMYVYSFECYISRKENIFFGVTDLKLHFRKSCDFSIQ